MTDSGSQDIPAWLKLAWSKPPKKGDILFRSVTAKEGDENDWETNARVSKASEYAYAEGYRLAGRILAAHVIQNKWDADFLVYPIVFLYRHNVELQFKRLIPMGASLTEQALSEADWRMLQESHDLSRLWALFTPILQIAGKGLASITKSTDCHTAFATWPRRWALHLSTKICSRTSTSAYSPRAWKN